MLRYVVISLNIPYPVLDFVLCFSLQNFISNEVDNICVCVVGNKEAKHSYIGVIPVLLNYCLESSTLLDIAMQLLVYIIIHPALKEDRQ